jgi:hypothetical protein
MTALSISNARDVTSAYQTAEEASYGEVSYGTKEARLLGWAPAVAKLASLIQ